MYRLAVFDIGTNSILLTIVQVEGGVIRTLAERSRITRLGEGLNATGRLSDEPMRRSLQALRDFLRECEQAGVDTILAVGTQVLREASNAHVFLQACEQMGLHVEVISGEREAYLSYLSVVKDPLFTEQSQCLSMLDVGGGSVEISRGCGGNLLTSKSYPIGAVRLTEAFLQDDPPSTRQIQALQEAVLTQLSNELPLKAGERLVGVGGTFVNLASLHHRYHDFVPERVHGATLTLQQMRSLAEELCSLPEAERRSLPGIEPDRAPVLHAGAWIASSVMQCLQAEAIIVSMRGLRWGLVYEYADSHRD
ncbi:MAG: Ppx/GppA phosphatase family protein [Armatimonadota bacterium]